MDELKEEYAKISEIKVEKTKKPKLEAFQDKLSKLTFLDPACGSGNFLTETYISLRRLENLVIRDILDCDRKQIDGQIVFGDVINPIKIFFPKQFYGIEINDFAVTVAKTALWIAESQMMKETEDILSMSLDFLPLKTNASIFEGDALEMDWGQVTDLNKLSYIMGNPPFLGYSHQTSIQKKRLLETLTENGEAIKGAGKADFVIGWYYKAARAMKNTNIKTCFVSTNSITQGEQPTTLWKVLFEKYNAHIDFAYRTFKWTSESASQAAVHCVIIAFSCTPIDRARILFDGEKARECKNINPYLLGAQNIFIEPSKKPLCNVPMMTNGNRPTDDGNLIIEGEEYEEFCKGINNPERFIRPFVGSREYLNNIKRYCLWLDGTNVAEANKYKNISERLKKCQEFRSRSSKKETVKCASTPYLFQEIRQPNNDYLVLPVTTSENRRYIPIGYIKKDIICSNALMIIPNADLYMLGVMISNVHMAWMRAFTGRMKSDYQYSAGIVYNNFPWPTPTEDQKKKIEETAQGILDARALYPDSSLADLYDPLTMPVELQKAHTANDKAVMQAYGFDIKSTTEADCVAKLMQMYKELTDGKE